MGDFGKRDVVDMRIVAHVPAGTEVLILGEHDSYWQARESGAVLQSAGVPAADPNSCSAFRAWLPAEATVLAAGYVRARARGVWKDGAYRRFTTEEFYTRYREWEG